jgi:hypothetical protein
MPENKENSVSVRIPQSVYDEIEEEQRATRKQTGRKPSIGLILARTWRGRKAEPGAPTPAVYQHLGAHDLLEFILQHGSKKDVDWITGNLVNFGQAIRSRTGKPESQRKAS